MKKIVFFLLINAVFLGMSFPVQAAFITFDEPGISLGDTITTQYATSGLNWIANPFVAGSIVENSVVYGPDFKNAFPSDGNCLHYDGTIIDGTILLDSYSDFLSFEYRRPSSSGYVRFALYDYVDAGNYSLIFDTGDFIWDSGVWDTFTYNGLNGSYNLIQMSSLSNNKFVIDNLSTDAVPVPSAIYLLGSGLMLLVGWRRTR